MNKTLNAIKLFFSPKEFWAVYLFCIYAFLYGLFKRSAIDEVITEQWMIVTPVDSYGYYITTASLTCLVLWIYTVTGFIRKILLKDYIGGAVCMIHIFLMLFLAKLFSMYGFGIRWALITN